MSERAKEMGFSVTTSPRLLPSSALLLFLVLLLLPFTALNAAGTRDGEDEDNPPISSPTPSLWPERFHAQLYMNLTTSGRLQITELWYDWPAGRNMNLIQKQLGDAIYDVEWDNGTSYYYTLMPTATCLVRHFPVGIPRPDWLLGSTYLGLRHTDGFLCHVWEKLDFIWYYEDVETHRPVRWDFYDGISTHVITYEVGAQLEDAAWQAPSYCFAHHNSKDSNTGIVSSPIGVDVNHLISLRGRISYDEIDFSS